MIMPQEEAFGFRDIWELIYLHQLEGITLYEKSQWQK